jgi:CBS domain-containing protein
LRDNFLQLEPHNTLREALAAFGKHDGERLPVVSRSPAGGGGGGSGIPGDDADEENEGDAGKLLGSISKTDVILAIAAAGEKAGVGAKVEAETARNTQAG